MKKLYLTALACLLLTACESVERMSIDYMVPAQVNFPNELRQAAIVNNVPTTSDTYTIEASNRRDKIEKENLLFLQSKVFAGDPAVATESMAEEIAKKNYFDKVIICDSVLRANDSIPRNTELTQDEVNTLAQQLGADVIISLEDLQMRSVQKAELSPYYGLYFNTMDVQVCPTVRVYIPGRKRPATTLSGCDSIYWNREDIDFSRAKKGIVSDAELLRQSSDFAGSVVAKMILPSWETTDRYIYSSGSANGRDAAIYAKEQNWDNAIVLWKQIYDKKKGKEKMFAAYDVAFGYEMQDNMEEAYQWAQKAQQIAYAYDKVEQKQAQNGQVDSESVPYYYFITQYVNELQKRKDGMTLLNIQMRRMQEDY